MQIVIDIPNSLYANLAKIQRGSIASKRILDCVRQGTPLPKGHGRLIDADDFFEEFCELDIEPYNNAPTVLGGSD